MRQLVLDTETTGLDPTAGHRIIEIGIVELINRKITDRIFHAYVNPERSVDPGAFKVHGLSTDFLKDKPIFLNVLPLLLNYLRDQNNSAEKPELIIHNAAFDTAFINQEFRLLKNIGLISDYCKITDSLAIARNLHPGQKNNLDALCKRYNIDNTQRELHGAIVDAKLLAKAYLAMTGGQRSLFGHNDEHMIFDHAESGQFYATNTLPANRKIRVIKATPEEVALHQARMEAINSY